MPLCFEWEDAYCVDHGQIDADHQHLFELANGIALMAESDADIDELKVTTKELYRYMEEHFTREERLMREAEYSDYDEHVAAHEAIIGDMNLLLRQSGSVNTFVSRLNHAMVDWVVQHIIDRDKALTKCVPMGGSPSATPEALSEIDWE